MKLDKIAFVKVIDYIGNIVQRNNLDSTDVEVLDNLIDIEVPQAEKVYASAEGIERMLCAMQSDRKIDAIREHRAMTGMELKESKDLIEKYWPKKPAEGSWTKKELLERHLKINYVTPNDSEAVERFLNNL